MQTHFNGNANFHDVYIIKLCRGGALLLGGSEVDLIESDHYSDPSPSVIATALPFKCNPQNEGAFELLCWY